MVKKVKKRAVKKKATRKLSVLPKKLSALVKLALQDIRKAEKLPEKYIFEMDNSYHEPTEVVCSTRGGMEIKRQPACVLCAAGAVMAFSLKADFTKSLSPSNFGKNELQLDAIDSLRIGHVVNAYTSINGWSSLDNKPELEEKLGKLDAAIPDYDRDNPEPFHKAMTKLGQRLRKAGL